MKFTTNLTIRQLLGHWFLWLLVSLLSFCLVIAPAISATGEMRTYREDLLGSMIRRGDMDGPLFPWRIKRSRRRRRVRLPQWLIYFFQVWAWFRQMQSWNMAQWVDFFSRGQISKHLGAMLILYPLLEELEVAEIVNRYLPTEADVEHGTVVVVLILNRLTAPRPLYKISRWLAYSILAVRLGIPASKFNDDRLGRTLDALAPCLREIWLEIVSRALERYDIDLSVIFYDLTAFIMMGDYKDSELVDFGFAHNTPMDKKKVKLAGNASQDGGILFDWEAICGRVADTQTVDENLQRLAQVLLRKNWPVEEILVVGDRAMLNNRLAILYDDHKKRGLRYLAGLEPRSKEHKELLASVSLSELKANHLLGKARHRYWGVKRPITFTYEDEETGVKHQATHTALVVLSEATRRSWRSRRIEQLRELSQQLQVEVHDKLNQPYWRNPETIRKRAQSRLDASSVGELLRVEVWGEYGAVEMRWWVDRAALREKCRLTGYYLLVTNDSRLSAVKMLSTYKDKDQVEKRFQIAKHVLQVRPIYLHKDERIRAMLAVNMMALLVYSLAERRCQRGGLSLTGRQLLYEFAPLHVIETHCWDGSILYRSLPLTAHQQEILERMGLAESTWWQSGECLILPPAGKSLLQEKKQGIYPEVLPLV